MVIGLETEEQKLRRTIIRESIPPHGWANITFTDDGLGACCSTARQHPHSLVREAVSWLLRRSV